jgi:peptide/nickel transport system permease protein
MSLHRFVIRRLVYSLLLLVAVSVLSFAFMELAPGDFLSEMRMNPQISPETIASLRHQYGLDESLPMRYAHWVASVARGEFGYSFAYNRPVAPLLWERGMNTLLLSIIGMALTWFLAVPIGAWSAARQGRISDKTLSISTVALYSVPDLLIALLFLLLAVRTGWFATGGMASIDVGMMTTTDRAKDIFRHFTLPIATLVLANTPLVVRHVRAALIEAASSPFVTSLRAHGVSEARILWVHLMPLAANPLLSLWGVSFGTLLSGSLVVELVLTWPGLGPLLLEAAFSRDVYVLIGVVMISTTFLLVGTILSDCLLLAIDPRIRRESAR